MRELIQTLQSTIDELSAVARYGSPCDELSAAESANAVLLRAACLGFTFTPSCSARDALAELGRCLAWLRSLTPPVLMTTDEAIVYLRLDDDDRDPHERLRNLIRRQRLPVVRKGRLQLFSRAAVDAWIASAGK